MNRLNGAAVAAVAILMGVTESRADSWPQPAAGAAFAPTDVPSLAPVPLASPSIGGAAVTGPLPYSTPSFIPYSPPSPYFAPVPTESFVPSAEPAPEASWSVDPDPSPSAPAVAEPYTDVLIVTNELNELYTDSGPAGSFFAFTQGDLQQIVTDIGSEILTSLFPDEPAPECPDDKCSSDDIFKIKTIEIYAKVLPNVIPIGDYKEPLEKLAKYLLDGSDAVKKLAESTLVDLLKNEKVGKATRDYLEELIKGDKLSKEEKERLEKLLKDNPK